MSNASVRITLLALGATLLAPGLAKADEPRVEAEPGAPTSVAIELQVVEGSMTPDPHPDPALAKLRKRLADFRFASFRLIHERSLKLGLKSREVVSLPGDRSLEVTARKFERSGKMRVHLHLKSPSNRKIVDTEYAIEPGGDLVVGGVNTNSDKLILLLHHGSKTP